MFIQNSQNIEAIGNTTYLKAPLGFNLEYVGPERFPTLGINDGCFAVDAETNIPYYVGHNYWREILFTKFHVSHAWINDGNMQTDPTKNFIGTLDNVAFMISAGTGNLAEHGTTRFTTNGQIEQLGTGNCVFLGEGAGINTTIGIGTNNTFLGYDTGNTLTTGMYNTATGKSALRTCNGNENTAYGFASQQNSIVSQNSSFGTLSMQENISGIFNTAIGYSSMQHSLYASNNTFVGYNSYRGNNITAPTGNCNTGIGVDVLRNNLSGNNNTVAGYRSMFSNTTGYSNVTSGYQSMFSNTTGHNNVTAGYRSLYSNTIGETNIALGSESLYTNIDGNANVAIGFRASYHNTSGLGNLSIGTTSLNNNTVGNYNIGLGYSALPNNISGDNNIGIGVSAGENYLGTENNCIFLGSTGLNTQVGLDGQIEIGTLGTHQQTFIQGVFNNTPPQGSLCPEVNIYGKLGVPAANLANTENVSPIDDSSNNLYNMTPAKFTYVNTPTEINFGLIAEDVENNIPELVVYDIDSNPYGVKYQQLSVLILNETIKLERRETITENLLAVVDALVAIHDAFLRVITGGIV